MAEPALFQHCETVYKAMREESSMREIDGLKVRVYEGFLTKLVRAEGLPTPYYSFVTNALLEMDCIRQIRRGGGSTPSQWALLQEPSAEMFHSHAGDMSYSTRHNPQAVIEQQMRDFNVRLLVVEEALGLAG